MTPIERVGYLAHAKSKSFLAKVARAQQLIKAHLGYAVSVSWGKDSVVMLHLAASVYPDLTAINIRYPHWAERLADHDRVRDEFLARDDAKQIDYHEVISPGMWQAYEKFGIHGPDTKKGRAAIKWFDDHFNQAFNKVDCDGYIVGMRAGESQRRTWNILKRGVSYQRADGRNMLLPLAGWSGKDVWAYIIKNNLPYLMIYDVTINNRDRQRSEISVSNSNRDQLQAMGEFIGWGKCYAKELNAWYERWPELK